MNSNSTETGVILSEAYSSGVEGPAFQTINLRIEMEKSKKAEKGKNNKTD
jgi:hypothetical protein